MRKLKLFFMMAFTLLVTGWAYAQNNYPITVTLTQGEHGESATTGIFKNGSAIWTKAMTDPTYFETEKVLTVTYQQRTDQNGDAGVDPIVKEYGIIEFNGQTPTQYQFVMDNLVPNTLYSVQVRIGEPDADGHLNEQATVYESHVMYFLSDPAKLKAGELVWNWEPEKDGAYEYLDEDNQVDATGKLMWQFDKFNESLSVHTEVPGIVGHVTVYENDAVKATAEAAVSDDVPPMANTEGIVLSVGKSYKVEAYATYSYTKKVLHLRTNRPYAGAFNYIEYDGTETLKFDAVPRGPRTYGGSDIDPKDIHVGVLKDAEGNVTATTVTVVNLPKNVDNSSNGKIRYSTDGGATWEVRMTNLWKNSGMCHFIVPETEDFIFTIVIEIQGDNYEFFEKATPGYGTTNPTVGKLHFGNASELDLLDKYWKWNNGAPSYVLPLPEGGNYTGSTFDLFYHRHIGNNSYEQDMNDYSGKHLEGQVADGKVTFLVDMPSQGTSGAEQTSWYRHITISASGSGYIESQKNNWNFYTSEGCVVTKGDEFASDWTFECADLLFEGNVTARQWDDPTQPLMDPDDPTQPAKLYYYDWAWTPGAAATIDAIKIEHNDQVKFFTLKEDGTPMEEKTMTSEIAYSLPTKYNNGQTIEGLTVYEGAPMAEADFSDAYYTRTVANPTGEVVTYDNWSEALWGTQYVASVGENNKAAEWGPFTFTTVIKGEVLEGLTVESNPVGFTMACREGKVKLGSAGTDWNTQLYNEVPTFVFTPTTVLGRPTVEPQYIIHEIFNNVYHRNGNNRYWDGECDFTIHATLTQVPVEGETTEGPWTAADLTGTINALGEVKLDNMMAFIEVPDNREYDLVGYMLYTPRRYTTLDIRNNNPVYRPGTPEDGPVVVVPINIRFTVPEQFDMNKKVTPVVKYYVVDKDADGQGYVQARIYDKTNNPNQIGAELLTNSAYTAAGIEKVKGAWVPAEKDIIDGVETVIEPGYFSFIFPVDNEGMTPTILEEYIYGYKCYFTNGSQYGPVLQVLQTSADAIMTPNPYMTFEKHDPADDPYLTETVGPWEDEMKPLCDQLNNIFAFTNSYLPYDFENYEDYWVKPTYIRNLVYGCYTPTAPAWRGAAKSVKKFYAPKVRLSDEKKDGVRYSYFNDVEFEAGDALYTADFEGVQSRSVIVPFDAETDGSVNWLSAGYVEDDGESVRFRFSQRKKSGEVYNHVDASVPYVVVSKAGGSTVDFTGEDVTIETSLNEKEHYMTIRVSNASANLMEVYMYGSYSPKWNQQIVPNPGEDNYDLGYYRFKNNSILQLMKKGDVIPESDTELYDPNVVKWYDASYKDGKSRAWRENFNGVNAFECYFTFFNSGYAGSISVRFDDEDDDATMIQNINVETESSELFDLMGRKVLEPIKGQIYIQNGKKILF